MPEVSRFFGITISLFYNDHNPPHFHAEYGDDVVLVKIETLETLIGKIPRRAHALVIEWASEHRPDLQENWELARQGRPLNPIPPLS